MKKDAILEIGTEEIPSSFLPPAINQLKSLAEKYLAEDGIEYTGTGSFATPRRLVLCIDGLEEKTKDKTEEIIGPPLRIAKDEQGNFTKAATGFANSQNIKTSELKVKSTSKGEYIVAVKHHSGKNIIDLLPEIFLKIISSINFPKTMVWNACLFRFARPIRSILALYGNQTVRFTIAEIKSTNYTCGIFTAKPKKLKIASADRYMQTLRNNYIIVDQEQRKESIKKISDQALRNISGKLKYSEELIDEVNYLVECPAAVLGEFSKDFLKLPEEIIVKCLEKHQKFFAITDRKNRLMNYFLAIRNGISEHQNIVKEGYERVVSARLKDAGFFFQQDIKTKLQEKSEKLKGVTFQQNLGTIHDKLTRIKELSGWILETINTGQQEKDRAAKIISLCKNDLVTEMVYEYPELQGVMGRIYALHDSEHEDVARGIEEHYWPLTAMGELPSTLPACIIAIADKMDTIVSNFIAGLIPTGSTDPYGLRKFSTGILRILMEKGINLDMPALIEKSYDLLSKSFQTGDRTKNLGLIASFMSQRFENLLEEKGYKIDEIRAVLAPGLSNAVELGGKLKAVHEIRKITEFESFILLYKRTANILKQADKLGMKETDMIINPEKLLQPEENKLFDEYKKISEQIKPLYDKKDYLELLKALVTLRTPIDNFFDKVLVLDKVETLRNNRLVLLKNIVKLFLQVGDFSLLQ